MIICGQCGERNAPGEQFCGSCGAFLEWDGAAVEQAPARTPGTPPPGFGQQPQVPAQPPAGYGQPGVYGQPSGYAQPGGYPPAGLAPPGGQPGAMRPVQPGAVQPGVAQPGAVQPGLAQPGQPGAVQPGEVQKRRYVPPPEAPVVNPGDIVCRSCGTGNENTRVFCRMCGSPLAGSPVATGYGPPPPVKVGWWKRHFGRNRQGTRVHDAGDRPVLRRKRAWRRWVALLVVAAGIAGLALGPGPHWISQLKSLISSKTSKPVPFTPQSMAASASDSGHGPTKADDGVSNDFWAPPKGHGTGEWLEAEFPTAFQLTSIVITSGASDQQAQYLAQARPQTIEVDAADKSGKIVATKTVTLVDRAGPQTFSISASGVQRVRLTIRSVFGQQGGHFVAIAEVEFAGRS
jgi:hypothetical protein